MQEATPQRIWETALGQLQLQVTRPNYETWLKDTVGLRLDNGTFVVGARSDFVTEWLSNKLRPLIAKTISKIAGRPLQVSFEVISSGTDIGRLHQPLFAPAADTPTNPIPHPHLNEKYTFERFVVGSGSRLAHAAALAVADRPGQVYNPLFICGGPGLGKTHLLQAIGHRTAGVNGHRLLYVTSEQFTNQFINAIATGRTDEFRRQYRTLDLLLIDDIQFLAGKERTQEEFFHTLNELHAAARQIVVCADRFPRQIPAFEDRLRSRLEWGLVADIKPPDQETRFAILKTKARDHQLPMPDAVIHLLAQRHSHNVRDLEGSLNRVIAYARLMRTDITLSLAQEALSAFTPPTPTSPPDPQAILHTVCKYFNISLQDLRSNSRNKNIADARHIAMYLLREDAHQQLKAIGHLLGNRDHSTVIHACRKVNSLSSTEPRLRLELAEIRALLHS